MGASEVMLKKLKAAGVRPKDLAEALGVKRPMASLMLSGQRGIAAWHLDGIAALLKTDVPDLFVDRDLSRHAPDQKREPHTTGGSDAATTRLLEQLADAEKTISEMRTAAGRIAALATKQITEAENHRTRTAQPGRGAHRRRPS